MRAAELRGVAIRIRITCAVLLLGLAALTVRAAHLTLVDRRGAERGDSQTRALVRVPSSRGSIFDRGGAPLALSVPAPSVYVVPAELEDTRKTARALAGLLDRDARRLRRRLERRSPFVFVDRWLSPERAEAVAALELPGVGIVEEPRRVYPLGALTGPVVGFANIDGIGVRGIERKEEAWLQGHALRVHAERDARRRVLAPSDLDPRAAAGADVRLTLDSALQAAADAALAQVSEATRARGGSIVALDPASGEVLALVERPGFDPNRFREFPFAETRARSILDAAEPGSTFKPFLVAAALEAGVLAASDLIDCEGGSFRVPGKTIRDLRPHALLDLAGVLRVSSNIGAVKIAQQLGARDYHAALKRFGFGASTGSGFPGESAGLLRPARRWRPVDQAAIAYGQGVSVTPLQLASALGALANGGLLQPPRWIAARRTPGGVWEAVPSQPPRRVVRAEVAASVLQMLEGVVSPDGTGRRGALRDVRVAGKTGTAQKLDPSTGGYSSESYLAWFAGVVPADAPRLVVVVMVDEPRERAHSGGVVAAPVFAEVAAAFFGQRGVATAPLFPVLQLAAKRPETPPVSASPPPPSSSASVTQQETPAGASRAAVRAPQAVRPQPSVAAAEPATAPAPVLARMGDRLLLPDFRGLSPTQVEQATQGSFLAVELLGEGRAVAQEPAPGSVVVAGLTRLRVHFAAAEDEG